MDNVLAGGVRGALFFENDRITRPFYFSPQRQQFTRISVASEMYFKSYTQVSTLYYIRYFVTLKNTVSSSRLAFYLLISVH